MLNVENRCRFPRKLQIISHDATIYLAIQKSTSVAARICLLFNHDLPRLPGGADLDIDSINEEYLDAHADGNGMDTFRHAPIADRQKHTIEQCSYQCANSSSSFVDRVGENMSAWP